MENFETPNTNNSESQEPTYQEPKPVSEMTEDEINEAFNNLIEPIQDEIPPLSTEVSVDARGDVRSITKFGDVTVGERMREKGVSRWTESHGGETRLTTEAPLADDPTRHEEPQEDSDEYGQ